MAEKIVNEIVCADVLDGLDMISDDMVSLTVTSPPYNVKINYDNSEDNLSYEGYLNWLKDVFTKVFRVTREGGRCIINIDSVTNRQEDRDQEYIRCIYAHLYNMMKEIGWKYRAEICWYKQNAAGKKTGWGSYMACSSPIIRRNHEYILIWSKNDWRLDGDMELSDMTKKEFCDYVLSTWFITPETKRTSGHPAPFPEKLAHRLIKLFSYREDVVLDPFNGSGTTTAVAASLARKWIGIDNSQTYVDYAINRTNTAYSKRVQLEIIDPYIKRSERMKK